MLISSMFSSASSLCVCVCVCVLCASGMGITTYTAARILKGQLQNQTGEETVMTMDTFPSVGLAKVHTHTHTHAHTHTHTHTHKHTHTI